MKIRATFSSTRVRVKLREIAFHVRHSPTSRHQINVDMQKFILFEESLFLVLCTNTQQTAQEGQALDAL
jgi:hypothetical protein